MKIAVVGSREFKDKIFVGQKLTDILNSKDIVISGGARGVDSWAEETAKMWHCETIIFKPDWDKYGKSAGFRRNKSIVEEADKVIAFWDGKSKGTKHSIDLAIAMNKPVDVYIRN